jgi:hypothetical protein
VTRLRQGYGAACNETPASVGRMGRMGPVYAFGFDAAWRDGETAMRLLSHDYLSAAGGLLGSFVDAGVAWVFSASSARRYRADSLFVLAYMY